MIHGGSSAQSPGRRGPGRQHVRVENTCSRFVSSHPIHFIFHLQQKVLLAASSHAGFETVTAGPNSDRGVRVGDFFHQLHHRYIECNYGEPEIPCDQWFGSFHDGTPEAARRTLERIRRRRRSLR